jgi:hypothetical protein
VPQFSPTFLVSASKGHAPARSDNLENENTALTPAGIYPCENRNTAPKVAKGTPLYDKYKIVPSVPGSNSQQ